MAHRRGNFRVSNKRATFWGRSPADTAFTALAASSAVLDSTANSVDAGETIVRVRGQLIVSSDQSAVSEEILGAVGFMIVSDQAVATGVGALPTPYTDQDSDLFFVYQHFADGVVFLDSTGFQHNRFARFEFDSKVMRKFPLGTTLSVIVENGSTTGMIYALQYSVFFKTS